MSLPFLLPWAVAAWLLGVGLYGIVTSRNFVHLIGCLSVVQSSTYVLLLSVGFRTAGVAPTLGLALLLAACQLSWRHLPAWLATGAQRVLDPLSAGLRFLHDGAVGDTIAWVAVGLTLLTAAFGWS